MMFSYTDDFGNFLSTNVSGFPFVPIRFQYLLSDEPYYVYSDEYDSDTAPDQEYYWLCMKQREEAFSRLDSFFDSIVGSFLFIHPSYHLFSKTEESLHSYYSQYLFSDASSALAFAVENRGLFPYFIFHCFDSSLYFYVVASFAECCPLDYSPIVRLLGGTPYEPTN